MASKRNRLGEPSGSMTFGEKVLKFNQWLKDSPPETSDNIEVLQPFENVEVQRVNQIFYNKYFSDGSRRTFILGINPGRLGAGITGIPFTDPVQLEMACGITNNFVQRGELSSEFIYHMIIKLGGINDFYSRFYLTSVCPLGFMKNGINLNYYDDKELELSTLSFIHESMLRQLDLNANREIAYVLGEGKNFKCFSKMNSIHGYFKELVPLPHPRFIMQYKRKDLNKYVRLYRKKLTVDY